MSGIGPSRRRPSGRRIVHASMSVRPSASTVEPVHNVLFSEVEAGSGLIENSHVPDADAIATFGPSISCYMRDVVVDAAPCSAGCYPRPRRRSAPTPPSCSTKSRNPASRPSLRRRQHGRGLTFDRRRDGVAAQRDADGRIRSLPG